jgi:hypothetical protein
LITIDPVALRGSITLDGLTQGSQSLALGLILTAAPQLVEGSRLMMIDLLAKATASEDAWAPVANALGLFQNLKVLSQT